LARPFIGTLHLTRLVVLARHRLLRGLLIFPRTHARERSADRRSGACEAPLRGSMTPIPQTLARRLASRADLLTQSAQPGTLASRRSTSAIFWLRARLVNRERCRSQSSRASRSEFTHPLVVAGDGWPRAPPGGLLARQPAERRSRPAHAMPRDEHPWRTERQDDNRRHAAVKFFTRYPQKRG
jgi:hypothetical protein